MSLYSKRVASLTVIVPVYNSAKTLPNLIRQLKPVLEQAAHCFELILIDDDSHDESWRVIEELVADESWVHGIRLKRNYGQHNAILCGIRQASGEIVITMDDDLQHPPEEIHKLLCKLAEGYDVVYGSPIAGQHGLFRNFASQITKMILRRIMDSDIARNASAFRAFRLHLRDAFANYRGRFVSIDVLLSWATTRFASITVAHEPRRVGSSNYTIRKLIIHAINMLTGFSTFPLRIASFIGFAFTLFGLGVLLYVVGRYLFIGGSVPGFPFLASVIAIFSGAQLFALGIIGEYLAPMHLRSMGYPSYSTRCTTGNSLSDEATQQGSIHLAPSSTGASNRSHSDVQNRG